MLGLYVGILQHFKQYVMMFQGESTLAHLLHHRQMEAVKRFLVTFVATECFPKDIDDPDELKKIDLSQEKNIRDVKDFYYGEPKRRILKGLQDNNNTVVNLVQTIKKAYIACGSYMLHKLPLNNPILLGLACLDPEVSGHSNVTQKLEYLAEKFIPFLPEEVTPTALEMEIKLYTIDRKAPRQLKDPTHFWNSGYITATYPTLRLLANLAFSIFHGPAIESMFSRMSSVLNKQRNRLDIETVNSLQTCKYYLSNKKTTAIKLCRRDNISYGRIKHPFCPAIMGAAKRHKQKQQKRLNELERKRQLLGFKKVGSASKAIQLRKDREAKRAKAHRKRAMEELAAARKAKRNKRI